MTNRNALVLACALSFAVLAHAWLAQPFHLPGMGNQRLVRTAPVVSPFLYTFNARGILQEAPRMAESTSSYWWLNSGGELHTGAGVGNTMQGEAPLLNRWRIAYALSNSVDTDGGAHPQNIFRLVSRSSWEDVSIELPFRIAKHNFSDSPNRNASNGVLLMGRYVDGDNLYYAGIRDDGYAIIKKKIGGTYHTLAAVQLFGTPGKYDRETTPSLLPTGSWMRIKMTIQNAWDGSVLIRLYLDRKNDGTYVSVLSARDRGISGSPLRESSHVGIRTDFKDVEFGSIRIEKI